MKRLSAIILITVLMFNLGVSALDNNEGLSWDIRESEYKAVETEWSFRPPAQYISEQNPPDFSWPWVNIATSYDLKVCSDEGLNNVVYEKKDIKTNFYNFPYLFEPGIYYWSVRFQSNQGVSQWTKASRFILTPEAQPYIVPEIDDILRKVPKTHPRIGVNQENIETFRELCLNGGAKTFFKDNLYKTVMDYMQQPIPTEPIFDPSNPNGLRGVSSGIQNLIIKTGFVYLITQDKNIGEFGVKALIELASWDPNGNTAYENQDQAFREFLNALIFGYDYLYDLLSESQRSACLNAIRQRGATLEHPSKGLTDAIYRIPRSPFMSHGFTAMGYLLTAAIAVYGEIDEAEKWLRDYLLMYCNINPPWGNEDGSWAQGTGYGKVSVLGAEDLRMTLRETGMVDVNSKAFYRNLYKFGLYTMGLSTGAEFGDQSTGIVDGDWSLIFKTCAYAFQSPYAMWQYEKNGIAEVGAINKVYLETFEKPEAKAPIDIPRSYYFKDSGWIAMHSSLEDLNGRVSMYFKSSPYGSYNHSHPDQNSFQIQAYGERLAIDSGYYDYYHSPFDLGYTKKSYAHNTITFNGGISQPPNSKRAKGDIINFITHPDFDLASGDASNAYNFDYNYTLGSTSENKKLDRFKRHIIYVRPDQFIVIDDLKTIENKKYSFEWWLNAYDNISLYKSRTGARIVKGKAALDAKIQYPTNIKAYYSDIFSGPDLTPLTPSGSYINDQVHKRVWFATEPTSETKIVTTMGVHLSDENAQYVKSEIIGNVNKLQFQDGTIAYVKIDSSDEMNIDGITTDAVSVVKKRASLMMVDGTYLKLNDAEIIKSDEVVSVAMGRSELSISCYKDSQVSITIDEITKICNERGIEIPKNNPTYGLSWDYQDSKFTANAYKGFYTCYLNGKSLPGASVEGDAARVIIDNEEKQIDLKGYLNHDGNKVLSGEIFNNSDFYIIEEINNINLKNNSKAGEVVLLKQNETIYPIGDNPYLNIKSFASGESIIGERTSDHNGLKQRCDIFVEAEDFAVKEGTARPYSTRSFLSGGVGVTEFNNFGDSATWIVNVKEDGYYDIVIKYVGWGEENVERIYQVNKNVGTLLLPATQTYGQIETEWVASRFKTKIYLEKGKNEIKLYPKSGSWNFDWIGLIKSDR